MHLSDPITFFTFRHNVNYETTALGALRVKITQVLQPFKGQSKALPMAVSLSQKYACMYST